VAGKASRGRLRALVAICGLELVGSLESPPTSIASPPRLEVLAAHLDNPCKIALGPDGAVYVVEAGTGRNTVAHRATLQPNSTHVAQDNNQPSLTRTSFTTLASGTPLAPATVAATSTTRGSSTSTDIVGSARPSQAVAGSPVTLAALIGRAGATSLTLKGKPALSLKAGRYGVSVTDQGTAPGLTVRLATAAPAKSLVLTGNRVSIVQLTAGRWLYYAGSGATHRSPSPAEPPAALTAGAARCSPGSASPTTGPPSGWRRSARMVRVVAVVIPGDTRRPLDRLTRSVELVWRDPVRSVRSVWPATEPCRRSLLRCRRPGGGV